MSRGKDLHKLARLMRERDATLFYTIRFLTISGEPVLSQKDGQPLSRRAYAGMSYVLANNIQHYWAPLITALDRQFGHGVVVNPYHVELSAEYVSLRQPDEVVPIHDPSPFILYDADKLKNADPQHLQKLRLWIMRTVFSAFLDEDIGSNELIAVAAAFTEHPTDPIRGQFAFFEMLSRSESAWFDEQMEPILHSARQGRGEDAAKVLHSWCMDMLSRISARGQDIRHVIRPARLYPDGSLTFMRNKLTALKSDIPQALFTMHTELNFYALTGHYTIAPQARFVFVGQRFTLMVDYGFYRVDVDYEPLPSLTYLLIDAQRLLALLAQVDYDGMCAQGTGIWRFLQFMGPPEVGGDQQVKDEQRSLLFMLALNHLNFAAYHALQDPEYEMTIELCRWLVRNKSITFRWVSTGQGRCQLSAVDWGGDARLQRMLEATLAGAMRTRYMMFRHGGRTVRVNIQHPVQLILLSSVFSTEIGTPHTALNGIRNLLRFGFESLPVIQPWDVLAWRFIAAALSGGLRDLFARRLVRVNPSFAVMLFGERTVMAESNNVVPIVTRVDHIEREAPVHYRLPIPIELCGRQLLLTPERILAELANFDVALYDLRSSRLPGLISMILQEEFDG